jgi:uncharacterized membrane protein YesL
MVRIFRLVDFTKEGPGALKDEPHAKGLRLFFQLLILNFWKLITLNFLFILFSIPVVTFPAAHCAITRVLRGMVDEELIFPWRDFLKAFRENFKQSLVYGIYLVLTGAVMYLGVAFYLANASDALMMVSSAVFLAAILVISIMNLYIPLMVVSVRLRFIVILNNAFRLSFIALWKNLLAFVIIAALVVTAVLLFPYSVLLIALLFFSFSGFTACFVGWPVIKKCVIIESETAQSNRSNNPA